MKIFCCGCGHEVDAEQVRGEQIYQHRPDLAFLWFWRCPICRNYVGCHHKSSSPTMPLGNIPTPEIRKARQRIHRVLDPLWENQAQRKKARRRLYAKISDRLGYQYHSGEIKSLDEANKVFDIVMELSKQFADVREA